MILEADAIEAIIPHRYPFLLVDRIVALEPGQSAVGLKNVTANEWFFQGHFPDRKIMPGVLIVEAMAQVAAVALMKGLLDSGGDAGGKLPLFGGIESMRFRKPVVPGDTLRMEFKLEKMRGPVGKGRVTATVDGKVAAEGTIMFALAEPS